MDKDGSTAQNLTGWRSDDIERRKGEYLENSDEIGMMSTITINSIHVSKNNESNIY